MSYKHLNHAANFADIHKHACLISAWQIGLKELGFDGFIDAFCGAPAYPLGSLSEVAIQHVTVLKQYKFPSTVFQSYSHILKNFPDDYPGSGLQILQLNGDNIHYKFNELNPSVYEQMKKYLANNELIALSQSDGYSLLESIAKRCFYFIDPPFIEENESQRLLGLCRQIASAPGIRQTLIWRPLFAGDKAEQAIAAIAEALQQPVLVSMLYLPWRKRLCGSLMLLGNYTEQQQQQWRGMEADLKSVVAVNREMEYLVKTVNPC